MNGNLSATVIVRALQLALLALAWSAFTRADAQDQAPTKPQAQYVWTGVRDGVQRVKPDELAGYAAQLERDLAKLRVAREVDGSAVDVLGGLRELWVRAALRTDYPRRWEVLAKVAVARASEYERRGELAQARGAVDELLLSAAVRSELAAQTPNVELEAASDELVRAAATAASTPELVALRTRLDAGARSSGSGARNSAQIVRSIEDAVDRALVDQQPALIVELGARAAPALEALVRAELDALPSRAELDPLVLLFRVDDARGAAFALENWNRGRLLWRKRVLRAMQSADVLSSASAWVLDLPSSAMSTKTPPTLIDNTWRELLARAVKDDEVGVDSFELVAKLAEFDALDAPLQAGLIAQLQRGGPTALRAARRLFEVGRGRESLRPVLERLLSHREPELQTAAASELVHFPRSAALLRKYASAERGVRLAVANSLWGKCPRVMYRRLVDVGVAPGWITEGADAARPPLEAGDSNVLDALLGDEDESVRRLALRALRESPQVTVEAARLLALARDASAELRKDLATWGRPEPLPAAVLEVLAADSETEVLRQVSRRFRELIQRTPDGRLLNNVELRVDPVNWRWSDDHLPALVAWLSNERAVAVGLDGGVTAAACRRSEGVRALVRLALERGPGVCAIVAHALASDAARTAWSALSHDEAVAIVRACWFDESKGAVTPLLDALPDEHRNALRVLLLDASAPSGLRCLCASASAPTADAEWRAALLDVFTGPDGFDAVKHFPSRSKLPDAERELLLQQLLALSGVDDEAVAQFFWRVAEGGPMSHALAVAVLERVGASDSEHWKVSGRRALVGLALSESEPHTELLMRVYPRDLGPNVLSAIYLARLDAHVPFLQAVLLGEPPLRDVVSTNDRIVAANALASHLDDRAAEILLKGLGVTTSKEVRDACFAALESIRRYEDERERWATRKTSRAAREAAIAELVPMLADKDATIRAQAARSLGALEAVEHLPALVRLLKDSNGDVRKAAQSAIDALTAPKPVAPAPAEPKRD